MSTRGPYKTKPTAGTLRALVDAFRASPRYEAWSPHTRERADAALARLVEKHGAEPAKNLTRGRIQQGVDKIARRDGYGAALAWLRTVSAMLAYGTRIDWIPYNPARDVEKPRPPHREGLRTWREDEVAAFLAHYPLGSTPHLAMTLMLYTGAGRSDACALGRQNIRNGCIEYRRQKTRKVGGPLISLPILPPLAEALALVPPDRMTFLETNRRRPRDPNGLTEEMRRWCRAAGLDAPDEYGRRLTCHGLRKAMARRLAEAGCTAAQIAAVTGHQSLREVERYTRAYDRAGAAAEALVKLADAPMNNVRTFRPKRSGEDGS